MSLFSRRMFVLLAAGIVVVGAGGAAAANEFAQPTAGLEDIGDWGEVSQDRTEIITSLWVNNPNPLGISIGRNVQASYELYLNDVNVAEGTKRGVSISSGNNTVEVSTEVRNKQLPAWWVAFIQNNETIPVRAETSATVRLGPVTASPPIPNENRTLLTNSTPVISSLSQVAGQTEGTYTTTVDGNRIQDNIDRPLLEQTIASTEPVTLGYEIRRGWATWGEVNDDSTTVYFHFVIHNPSEKASIPATPDNIGVTVNMNDVEMFTAQSSDTTLQNPEDFSTKQGIESRVLRPGETEEAVYAVTMDNDKIDEWFVSHVQRGEQTEIRTELQLVFSVGETTFRIPENSQLAFTCDLQTAILVDNQETQTTCQPENVGVEQSDSSSSGDGSTQTATETDSSLARQTVSRPTTVPNDPPTAHADANPTEGSAPLTVSFDASSSSDPNDNIEAYIWRFGDGSTPERGQSATHEFRRPGQYDVELTVRDATGETDSTTVTIEVREQQEGPTADASATPTSGEAPLSVDFDASGSSDPNDDIQEYVWRFNDGTSPARGERVTHTFDEAGQYTVELAVTDSAGNTDTDTVTIDVDEAQEPPTAVAEASPTSGSAPVEVDFDASGSSDPNDDIQEYVWRFKDGSTPARGETVTHTFRTAGTYEVELVVRDSEGNTDTDTVTITVEGRL